MVLWIIESSQKRRQLIDRSFRPCFYVQGPERLLARLAEALPARAAVSCVLTERQNIWDRQPLRVLQVSAHHPTLFAPLARFVRRFDSDLILYDSDLMLAPMYCWEKNVFPLARVDIEATEVAPGFSPARAALKGGATPPETGGLPGEIRSIVCRDDEWLTDYERPPVRTMRARLEGLSDVNPRHGRHGAMEVAIENDWQVLDDSDEPAAAAFERLLRVHDPDVLVTEWGDSVLLPGLLRQAQRRHIRLPLNRDPVPVASTRSRSYMSYGRILFKDSTTTLFGRLHIDTQNSFGADTCEQEGLWELVRVTKLPVQYACRTTPGTGISYLQMEVAWRDGVLIPAQKAEPESPKFPDELLLADRGGLVFPPRLGFFENVAELDFVSEFPSIMARFNISPETVNCPCCPQAPRVPELGYRVCQRYRGITSRVVERLIHKRRQYKEMMRDGIRDTGHGTRDTGHGIRDTGTARELESGIWTPESGIRNSGLETGGFPENPHLTSRAPSPEAQVPSPESRVPCPASPTPNPVSRNPSPAACKQRRDVLKWLLVCCFGYTGYKNARFGKIEAHEAINALAREKLLVAKEAAEQRGYRVLHALVDSLYVQKSEVRSQEPGASGSASRGWGLGAGGWGKTLPLPIDDGRWSISSIGNRQSKIGNCEKAADLEIRSALPSPAPSPQSLAPTPQPLAPDREDYERLAQEIEQLTGLPLALEAVYRYVVFLPSKQSAEIPVPNRFFCVSDAGELKVRGLECRRHDTPPFISRMQCEVLGILAEARDFTTYCAKLREAREVYERYQAQLREGSVAPEELVIRKRLTKAPSSYQKNSVTAIAARQLDRAGVKLRPGENIEFIITDADSTFIDDRVRAWTLWEGWRGYDVDAYGKALANAFEPAAHFGKTVGGRQ
jgi:DNA polymerase elongation subunit (family B)